MVARESERHVPAGYFEGGDAVPCACTPPSRVCRFSQIPSRISVCHPLGPPGSPRVAQLGTERHGNSNRRDDYIINTNRISNDMHAGIVQWQRETLMLRKTEGDSVGGMRGGRELDQWTGPGERKSSNELRVPFTAELTLYTPTLSPVLRRSKMINCWRGI
jgi:hypothetical protein